MKKIFYFLFIISLLSASVFSQSGGELYQKAVSFYNAGEYSKALDVLKKINSTGINTEPLRKEIEKKLTAKNKSDNDSYSKAIIFYNEGEYEEALKLLNNISSTSINTQPIITEINKKLQNTSKNVENKNNLTSNSDPRNKIEKTGEQQNLSSKDNTSPKTDVSTIQNTKKTKKVVELSPDIVSYDIKTKSKISDQQSEMSIVNEEESDTGLFDNIYLYLGILIVAFLIMDFMLFNNLLVGNRRVLKLISLSTNRGYLFKKREIKIGRTSDNDFVINDASLSKYHALIKYDKHSNRFFIKDLGSGNGTSLNGKEIILSELKNGDILFFSHIAFRVVI